MIKEIMFVFENCESIIIPANVIGELVIEDFTKNICRIACNAFFKMETCHTFAMEIFKEGNVEVNPFDVEEYKTTVFERITEYNDITSIEVVYKDGTIEKYYVDYASEGTHDFEENLNQHSYISEAGNLYIVIAENKDIPDFFDKEAINDKEAIEFTKSMYDIGDVEYPEEVLSHDNLPEFYRYVFLSESHKENVVSSFAVRVPVPARVNAFGWKWVFVPLSNNAVEYLNIPQKWQYLSDHMAENLNSAHYNDEYGIKALKEAYPLEG